MKHSPALLSILAVSLAVSACSPAAKAVGSDTPPGPYRVVSVADIFADAPKLAPNGDIKTFIRDRLDWAYAPGRIPLAVMDPVY